LSSQRLRFAITTAGCGALTYLGCQNLPQGFLTSTLRVSLYWMSSIRLVDLMTRPNAERSSLTMPQFVGKFAWFLFPVSPNPTPRPFREHLQYLGYHTAMLAGKLAIGPFLRTWLLRSIFLVGGGEVARRHYLLAVQLSSLWAMVVFTGTIMNEMAIILTSAVTMDRYNVLPFNNWPLLATSFREFWSKRYNLLVSSLLKESVFQPLQREGLSREWAALAVFAVSGALHIHVAQISFGFGALSSFIFFALHGVFCWAETRAPPQYRKNKLLSGVVTQVGLALTAPLYLGLFVYSMPNWLLNNPPEIPSPIVLPVPAWLYCPKP
jgi:hypothetical protein